jgi:hypothetical protein
MDIQGTASGSFTGSHIDGNLSRIARQSGGSARSGPCLWLAVEDLFTMHCHALGALIEDFTDR